MKHYAPFTPVMFFSFCFPSWKNNFSLRKQSRPVVGKLSPTIAFNVFDCQTLPILYHIIYGIQAMLLAIQ